MVFVGVCVGFSALAVMLVLVGLFVSVCGCCAFCWVGLFLFGRSPPFLHRISCQASYVHIRLSGQSKYDVTGWFCIVNSFGGMSLKFRYTKHLFPLKIRLVRPPILTSFSTLHSELISPNDAIKGFSLKLQISGGMPTRLTKVVISEGVSSRTLFVGQQR